MTVFRFPAVVLMLGLLSACDCADSPVPKQPKAPTVETPARAPVPAEATRPAASAAPLATQTQAPAAPLAEPLAVEPADEFKPALELPTGKTEAPDTLPVPAEKPSPPVQEKPAEKKTLVARPPSKAVPVEQAALPDADLDLSLPKGLLDSLQPAAGQAPIDRTLLPPLFEETADQDPFQLNGRLLTREREDAIEGAELRFEFKR